MKSFKILSIFLLLFCAPQLQVDSEAQIPIKKCSVCGRPVSNCDYKGNHPKCSICGKYKDQCLYKGNHPKCSTCGKLKEQCQYKGNHPVCDVCGKLKEQCSFKGDHPVCDVCGRVKEQCQYKGSHPNAKETFTVNGVQFTMILVEGNGSPYYIGETEVTQALWQAVMGSLPSIISLSSYDIRGRNRPVCHVSCDDCDQFIIKLNSLISKNFRLPSSSEWEYAAKGGKYTHNYTFSGSNNIDDVAWYIENTNKKGSHDVKTKLPDELGIYDMTGNVREWTSTTSGSFRVNRGGSWNDFSNDCTVTYSRNSAPTYRDSLLGFRLAL